MSFPEDGYRAMLNSFRTNDFQALLGAFGRNKAGRKNELKERAMDLLRNRPPPGFNQQAYCQKIMEIFRSMQSDVPNNDMLRSLVQNQQRQIVTLQSQHQRIFPPPQYPQQPMHLTRAGLPQVVPHMSRGIYGNNMGVNNGNIQYSYQPVLSRNMPQVSSGQQLNLMADSMVYDMNAPGCSNTYNQLSHFTSMNNIKFRKLPFFEVMSEIIKPTILNSQDRCTLPNVSRDVKEVTYKFQLSSKHATEIGMNRDLSQGKTEYPVQLQARICYLEPGNLEIPDCLPIGLSIRINGKGIPLPPTSANARPGTEARRSPRPINCSHFIKINPNLQNTITVNWTPDTKTYVIGVNLVRTLSSDTLIKRLQEKGKRSSEETKNYIIKKLANDDPDLATTSYRVSLVCPLGKMRMKMPAKSIYCDHVLQCFDASIFILMNEKKPTWTCPTCNKNCWYDDIQIESYFMDIISSPALTDSCKEIEVLADGTWRVYEESKDTTDKTPMNNKEKPIDSVDLDDSDDETPVEKTDPKLEFSKETNDVALKSSFIDLTLSDDDDEGTTRSKQENEAQAANAAQIPTAVDKKPQAQVQPKQAVTSSEQGDVIEIDSPTPPSSPALPSTPS
ncbi:Hypothetical protein CINCED_3A002116 [Cinara cedri]|nr:Hypothetical protein CINCED_3A002116 [Cinara cedri]